MMENNKILYYYANPRCSMSCKFCYSRWDLPNNSLSTKELKELILLSKDYGFNHFGFTGGNTFVRKDIFEILSFLKENNFKVRVDTHGIGDNIELIEKYSSFIDIIGLPLDGHLSSIHNFTRDSNIHFDIVVSLIKQIKKRIKGTRLKIHTVLNLRNYASVIMMKDLIEELKPDYWTIYKYFPAGSGYRNRKEFEIPNFLFNFAQENIPRRINNTIVDIPGDEVHDKSFLMVGSNGQIYGCYNKEKECYTDYGKYNEGGFDIALKHYGDEGINRLTNREFYGKNI